MRTRAFAGNAGAFVSALLFGGAVVATRVAVRDVPPLSLAVLRYGQGALILLIVLIIVARGRPRVDRRDLPLIALLGAVLFAIFPVTFNAGLDLTTASRGSLMLVTMPLWSAILARAMGQERLIPRQVAGVVLSVAGVGLVFAEGGHGLLEGASTMAGNGLLLLTALCGAIYGVLAKPILGRYPALTITAYTMGVGVLILLPISLSQGLPTIITGISGEVATLVLFLGIFGGALAFFLIAFALARLTPTQTAVYINLNPMVATALGALLLGERITGIFALGFIAVVAGLLLVNWPKARPTRSLQ